MSYRIYKTPERILAGAGLAVLGAGSFLVGYFDPQKTSFLPGCPLLNITGFACPGCGLTRGFHELFHGNLIAALDFNALVPAYAVIFLFLAALFASIAFRARDLKFSILSPVSLGVFLGVSFVFGVIRNIPVDPLTVLFP